MGRDANEIVIDLWARTPRCLGRLRVIAILWLFTFGNKVPVSEVVWDGLDTQPAGETLGKSSGDMLLRRNVKVQM